MLHRGKIPRVLLVVLLLNLTTGCFIPHPVGDKIPAPPADLRVRLNPEASARISLQAGRPVDRVAGQVIQASADSLVLAVRWGEVPGATTGRLGPDVVRLARHEAVEISEPRVSVLRTTLLVGGLIAALVALSSLVLESADPSPDDPSTDPQPR